MACPGAIRALVGAFIIVLCFVWSSVCCTGQNTTQKTARPTREDGLAAWQQVYSVLTSPRCINCHTATSYPQQGDSRQRHFAHVVRGPRGVGVPGLQCISC